MARNVITIINQDKKTITLTDKVSGNAVSVNTTTRKKIEAKTEATQVTVEKNLTDTIQILRQQGPRGVKGEKGDPGLLANFEDLLVVGSLNVTDNITGSFIEAKSGFIGNLTGTSSNATSASYAFNATSASFASDAVSSSYAISASYAFNATSASYSNDATSASYAFNATSASFATEASSAGNSTSSSVSILAETSSKIQIENDSTFVGQFLTTIQTNEPSSSTVIRTPSTKLIYSPTTTHPITGIDNTAAQLSWGTSSPDIAAGIVFLGDVGNPNYIATTNGDLHIRAGNNIIGLKKIILSGSAIEINGSITGSINSASYALSSSYAESSSFTTTSSFATTSSYALDATSASFATTASFALNVPADTGFPFTGSAGISGSLSVIGPITGSEIISSSGNISASAFFGDGSQLSGLGQNIFPFTGSAGISGSLNVEGSLTASSMGFLGDVSASTYFGDGGSLTGIGSNPFPFTGSAEVSGSFNVTGSITGSSIRSSGTGTPLIKSNTGITISAGTSVSINNILHLTPTALAHMHNPQAGDIVYSTASNAFYGWNGSQWKIFHS